MQWMNFLEMQLLKLWIKSEHRCQKKMMTKTAQHTWVVGRGELQSFAEEACINVSGLTIRFLA